MLIPLKPGELQRLIPAVATGSQFRASLEHHNRCCSD